MYYESFLFELYNSIIYVKSIGLDVDKCSILEIACIITDADLRTIAEVTLIVQK